MTNDVIVHVGLFVMPTPRFEGILFPDPDGFLGVWRVLRLGSLSTIIAPSVCDVVFSYRPICTRGLTDVRFFVSLLVFLVLV